MSEIRRSGWALLQHPVPLAPGSYQDASDWVASRLSARRGVLAVYAMGAVGQPGISDMDLFVVFEDGAEDTHDPLEALPAKFRPLFTHGLFGVARSFVTDILRYGHYPNLLLLVGNAVDDGTPSGHAESDAAIARQIALEYLMTNYISRAIELAYGVVNVRGLLLSAHAIRFDLQLLGIRSGPLFDLVSRIGTMRQTWFEAGQTGDVLIGWLPEFVAALRNEIEELCPASDFYLPIDGEVRYARHIRIERGPRLAVRRRGVRLPAAILQTNRALVRLQHRWNRFHFQIPATRVAASPEIAHRGERLAAAVAYNRRHLPAFTVPAPRLASLRTV